MGGDGELKMPVPRRSQKAPLLGAPAPNDSAPPLRAAVQTADSGLKGKSPPHKRSGAVSLAASPPISDKMDGYLFE